MIVPIKQVESSKERGGVPDEVTPAQSVANTQQKTGVAGLAGLVGKADLSKAERSEQREANKTFAVRQAERDNLERQTEQKEAAADAVARHIAGLPCDYVVRDSTTRRKGSLPFQELFSSASLHPTAIYRFEYGANPAYRSAETLRKYAQAYSVETQRGTEREQDIGVKVAITSLYRGGPANKRGKIGGTEKTTLHYAYALIEGRVILGKIKGNTKQGMYVRSHRQITEGVDEGITPNALNYSVVGANTLGPAKEYHIINPANNRRLVNKVWNFQPYPYPRMYFWVVDAIMVRHSGVPFEILSAQQQSDHVLLKTIDPLGQLDTALQKAVLGPTAIDPQLMRSMNDARIYAEEKGVRNFVRGSYIDPHMLYRFFIEAERAIDEEIFNQGCSRQVNDPLGLLGRTDISAMTIQTRDAVARMIGIGHDGYPIPFGVSYLLGDTRLPVTPVPYRV